MVGNTDTVGIVVEMVAKMMTKAENTCWQHNLCIQQWQMACQILVIWKNLAELLYCNFLMCQWEFGDGFLLFLRNSFVLPWSLQRTVSSAWLYNSLGHSDCKWCSSSRKLDEVRMSGGKRLLGFLLLWSSTQSPRFFTAYLLACVEFFAILNCAISSSFVSDTLPKRYSSFLVTRKAAASFALVERSLFL